MAFASPIPKAYLINPATKDNVDKNATQYNSTTHKQRLLSKILLNFNSDVYLLTKMTKRLKIRQSKKSENPITAKSQEVDFYKSNKPNRFFGEQIR